MEPDSERTVDTVEVPRSSSLTRSLSEEEKVSKPSSGKEVQPPVWPSSLLSAEGRLLPPTRYVCKMKRSRTVEKCGRQSGTCSEMQITLADGVKTVKCFEEGRLVAYTIDDVPQELIEEPTTTVDEEDKKKIEPNNKAKSVGSPSFLSALSQPYESYSVSVLPDDFFSYSKFSVWDGVTAGESQPGPSQEGQAPHQAPVKLKRRASS